MGAYTSKLNTLCTFHFVLYIVCHLHLNKAVKKYSCSCFKTSPRPSSLPPYSLLAVSLAVDLQVIVCLPPPGCLQPRLLGSDRLCYRPCDTSTCRFKFLQARMCDHHPTHTWPFSVAPYRTERVCWASSKLWHHPRSLHLPPRIQPIPIEFTSLVFLESSH